MVHYKVLQDFLVSPVSLVNLVSPAYLVIQDFLVFLVSLASPAYPEHQDSQVSLVNLVSPVIPV